MTRYNSSKLSEDMLFCEVLNEKIVIEIHIKLYKFKMSRRHLLCAYVNIIEIDNEAIIIFTDKLSRLPSS